MQRRALNAECPFHAETLETERRQNVDESGRRIPACAPMKKPLRDPMGGLANARPALTPRVCLVSVELAFSLASRRYPAY